jgi:hypothetical protein
MQRLTRSATNSQVIKMLMEIEGSRANLIAEAVKAILEISEEKLKELCATIEKMVDAAYVEGKEDGQWS